MGMMLFYPCFRWNLVRKCSLCNTADWQASLRFSWVDCQHLVFSRRYSSAFGCHSLGPKSCLGSTVDPLDAELLATAWFIRGLAILGVALDATGHVHPKTTLRSVIRPLYLYACRTLTIMSYIILNSMAPRNNYRFSWAVLLRMDSSRPPIPTLFSLDSR